MKLSRQTAALRPAAYVLATALFVPGLAAAAPALLSPAQTAAASVQVTAKLAGKATVGDNDFTVTVTKSDKTPVAGAKVTLSVAMTSMDMGTAHPAAHDEGDGRYTAKVNFSMAGPWRVTAKVEVPGQKTVTKKFDYKVEVSQGGMSGMDMSGGDSMPGMQMGGMEMPGRLGPWGMQREGSGTSWLPESSPMFMKMLPKAGRYDLDLMGFFTLNYSNSGGPRGDQRFYSNSMPMLMVRRETGGGILGMNLMLSLDPIFNGEYGYPNLFQTGETAYGNKLVAFNLQRRTRRDRRAQ